MPVLVLNIWMDTNMQLTINSFRQLFPDKIFSMALPWVLVKSLTFPWQLSNSLTFPGFPGFQTSGHPVIRQQKSSVVGTWLAVFKQTAAHLTPACSPSQIAQWAVVAGINVTPKVSETIGRHNSLVGYVNRRCVTEPTDSYSRVKFRAYRYFFADVQEVHKLVEL